MIRFEEISTKQSGARFSISFSKRKTKTKYQMNPPPIPSKQPPLFANNFVFEPMPNAENPISLLENLLKHPGRVVHELHQKQAPILAGLASHFRHHRDGDLWNSFRRAIRRRANVDRTS